MTNISQLRPDHGDANQIARARFVLNALTEERWTIRKAAMATGMSVSTLAGRLRGNTEFLAVEIASIATLLKQDEGDFFVRYLNAPTAPQPTNDQLSDYSADDLAPVVSIFGSRSA